MPEKRMVLRNCEKIDPGDLSAYMERDGFKGLAKAREKKPEAVIEEVKKSGLRGRGGAGFPCGVKWELANKSEERERFLICNADEGEMGTFKDRYIIQNDPFLLMEGIGIAAYAIGASKVYVYLRGEYRYLLGKLTNAIAQAKDKGLLRDLDIDICEGAGAYVCGEESALMNSIEGKRGEARFRPPYPPSQGLWERPTIINNVETLCNLPGIMLNGAQWFSAMGTEKSKGTKVFSVSGDVQRPGIYELEMGSSLKELVTDLAGAQDVKMVQVGGATGRILPESLMDTKLCFEEVLGSGGVIVFDRSRDIIEMLYHIVEFLAEESCGKCAPCREGTEVMVEILGRLKRGDGVQEDLEILKDLGEVMRVSSLCGLGQGTPVPVQGSLEHFRAEYETRIAQSQFIRGVRGQ